MTCITRDGSVYGIGSDFVDAVKVCRSSSEYCRTKGRFTLAKDSGESVITVDHYYQSNLGHSDSWKAMKELAAREGYRLMSFTSQSN